MLAMVGTNREGLKETIANSTGEGRTGKERLLQLHANILCSAAERRESSQLGLWLKREILLGLSMTNVRISMPI